MLPVALVVSPDREIVVVSAVTVTVPAGVYLSPNTVALGAASCRFDSLHENGKKVKMTNRNPATVSRLGATRRGTI